jgi:hypothetical protein
MLTENEYGWFSDIETNPDIIYVEYKHIPETGIYKVRNVHIEFPPPPIEISLTGECLSSLVSLEQTSNSYLISQTHYIDVPHIIYINEHPCDKEDPHSPEKIQECINMYNNCVQTVLYILTVFAIILVCCG